jgi:Protein of unknown function (DUF1571)
MTTRGFRICRLSGLIVLLLGLAASLPYAAGQDILPSPPTSSPLDRALRLIEQARKSYAKVEDYTCTLVRREQVNGQMLPENVILLEARNQPFSIHLKWQQPKALAGQEACYVAGRNNGMMRVKPPGLLGAMGFVNLSTSDAKVKQLSRHSITEAGIGNLIERFGARWEAERKLNRTRVRVAEFDFNGRKCVRVESNNAKCKPGEVYAYRSLVYFDKENRLPIRTEVYDWPKEGEAGKPEGELLECFSLTDLKLNVGLEDEVFEH